MADGADRIWRRLSVTAAVLGSILALSGSYRDASLPGPVLRREARAVIDRNDSRGKSGSPLPLQARVRSREERDGLLREQIRFLGEPGQLVPALVIRPVGVQAFRHSGVQADPTKDEQEHEPNARTPERLNARTPDLAGRLPAVVVLHGLGGSKEHMTGLMEDLARRGYLTLAIDARWHGERGPGLQAAMIRAFRSRSGHPYVYETVSDLFRTLDYLQSRPDVDGERIGMIGFSMGGQQTWITAALDPRVKVAVPAIGVYSFGWTVENDQWKYRTRLLPRLYEAARADLGEPEVNARVYRAVWDRLTPGLFDRFDGPKLLPLIAPRPLLILNGEEDRLVPIEAARLAAESARRVYKAAGVPDRFRFDVAANTAHTITDDQRRRALDWFDRWLKEE